ncbi:MAG: hypothetical protein LBG58_07410 [Planctomycetaceae bacterium]|jgi:hypothetical protein|nr:hypothetical protein [Planctomycetaceae bacterium]
MTKTPEKKQSLIQHLGCWGLIVLMSVGCSFLFFYYAVYYNNSGEHISVPNHFPQDATDYCFYEKSTIRFCEFNLSKDSFLKYCEKEKWEIEDIEKMEEIKYKYEKPFIISRYIFPLKPEHHKCNTSECKIEPTGRTENSCIRLVSKGYYYKKYFRAGRGFTVIYDSEQERCYCLYILR